MPLDFLRLARLDPVANLQRTLRIEDDFSPEELERGLFRISSSGLTDDSRRRHLDDADSVERLARHPRPHIEFSLDALPDVAHCDRVVSPRPRHPGVSGVSRQITPGCPEDE